MSDEVVGVEHGVLVVFHHDDRVADVAQLLERLDEALVVALVQADAGLVEDIEDACQLRANLRGQTDALRLAARQRRRGTVHAEVVDADVEEEMHALVDFSQNLLGNIVLSLGEFAGQLVDPLAEAEGVHVGHLGDVFAVDAEPLRLFLESGAAADGAGHVVHERAGPAGDGGGGLFVVLALDEVDDALEVDLVGRGDAEALAFHLEGLVGAVEDDVEGFVGDVFQRRVEGEAVFQAYGLQLLEDRPCSRLPGRGRLCGGSGWGWG